MLMTNREKFVVSGQGDWHMRSATRRAQKERKKYKRRAKQLWRRFANIQLPQLSAMLRAVQLRTAAIKAGLL